MDNKNLFYDSKTVSEMIKTSSELINRFRTAQNGERQKYD